MSAPIFSTRFIAQPGPASATYTVPAGHTAVVRSIVAWSAHSSAAVLSILLEPAGVYLVVQNLPAWAAPLPDHATYVWDVRVPLQAGEQIVANPPADAYCIVSGYLFVG